MTPSLDSSSAYRSTPGRPGDGSTRWKAAKCEPCGGTTVNEQLRGSTAVRAWSRRSTRARAVNSSQRARSLGSQGAHTTVTMQQYRRTRTVTPQHSSARGNSSQKARSCVLPGLVQQRQCSSAAVRAQSRRSTAVREPAIAARRRAAVRSQGARTTVTVQRHSHERTTSPQHSRAQCERSRANTDGAEHSTREH